MTALTQMLLANISKIMSLSASLIFASVTSLIFSWYTVFIVLMKNATVNNAA